MSKVLPLVLVSLIWFGIGWFVHELLPSTSLLARLPPEQLRVLKVQQILQNRQLLLEQPIAETAVPTAFADAAIAGMLSWSQDPHAELYGPLETDRYQLSFDGELGIANLEFDAIDGQLIVRRVPEESPAAVAGIRAGDILLGVDGVEFDDSIGASKAALLLQGPVGTTYTLKFQRGEEVLTRTVERHARTYLTYRLIDDHIGYIKVDFFFPEKTEQLFEAALEEFAANNVDAFIWDLRGNNGGYPVVAGKLMGYFVQPDTLFYTMAMRDGTAHEFYVEGDGRYAGMPIAVLIDKDSWSASEIAAAAMAQRPQTQLFGTTTAGKGTVQETTPLDDEHMLHFTVAKWLTPSGDWIHHKGLDPDVLVEDDPTTAEDEVLRAGVTYVESAVREAK